MSTPRTDKQVSYFTSLVNQLVAAGVRTTEQAVKALSLIESADIAEAGRLIEFAKSLLPATPAQPVVASGHYALEIDGTVKFFRVNAVTEGKWAGRTFVDVQASDEYFKAGREYSATVLALIAADPQTAMKLYGLSLGRCGHCRKTLTNAVSRAAGIGPKCAAKMGW